MKKFFRYHELTANQQEDVFAWAKKELKENIALGVLHCTDLSESEIDRLAMAAVEGGVYNWAGRPEITPLGYLDSEVNFTSKE